jgi:hypothetical protein
MLDLLRILPLHFPHGKRVILWKSPLLRGVSAELAGRVIVFKWELLHYKTSMKHSPVFEAHQADGMKDKQ